MKASQNPPPPFAASPHTGPWLLPEPRVLVQPYVWRERAGYIVRDDLLHPWISGNKLRKLDALWPSLITPRTREVLTLGGLQSAHCAAVACLACERGLKATALLRGEPPKVWTGNALITHMFATTRFVSRDDYADRDALLERERLRADPQQLAIIPEGARQHEAIPGLIRLVEALAEQLPDPHAPHTLIIDAGTGTSAVGLAIGVARCALPWQVHAVMLMPDQLATYQRDAALLSAPYLASTSASLDALRWFPRQPPRRFGQARDGELALCREIARQSGVLTDPIYTLAAWQRWASLDDHGATPVLIHTGGALNLMGVAQRWPQQLSSP